MKIAFPLLLVTIQLSLASELRLTSVTQPLYLHGSESDSRIAFESVPYVTFGADPEWRFSAISVPFIPPTGGSWRAHDVNLASIYHIVVDGTYADNDKDVLVTIDASKAAQPEGYPFSAVATCVKIMYPERALDEGALKISVRRGKSTK
jgi:hypothetical protein